MFYSLTGELVYSGINTVAVSCSGIAFKCTVSLNTQKKITSLGSVVTLFTYLSVREDAVELFGFADETELECFKMLIGVSGVGPKAAISILSVLTPDALALSVSSGDVKAIKSAQNVGPKLAQRIVLELKDKFSKSIPSKISAGELSAIKQGFTRNMSEAVDALTALGFASGDAANALSKADADMSVEDLIKFGLKMLSWR